MFKNEIIIAGRMEEARRYTTFPNFDQEFLYHTLMTTANDIHWSCCYKMLQSEKNYADQMNLDTH